MPLLPIFLSLLLLAAHLLRWLGPLGFLIGLAPLALLFVRRRWAALALQVVLLGAALEWLRLLAQIAVERIEAGEPWHRMAAILGGVALFTLASALVFRLRGMRERFAPQPAEAVAPAK